MIDSTKTIKAVEAARCIRSGMDDGTLMDRFNLSAKALQSLFDKLVTVGILTRSELEERASLFYESGSMRILEAKFPVCEKQKPRVKIYAVDVLNCVRSGMDDVALMKRYNLSAEGLQRLFVKTVASGTITEDELNLRMPVRHSQIEVDADKSPVPGSDSALAGIDTKEFLSHTDDEMDPHSVMEEYGISETELQIFLNSLVARGRMSEDELDRKMPEGCQDYVIRRRESKEIIFRGKTKSLRILVESALAAGVDLSEADLRGINLSRADLSRARLCRADLARAILVGADLSRAQLTGASLASAELSCATMYKTNLSEADLSDSNLTMIQGVSMLLCWADLSEANLTNANLVGANLCGAKLFQTILTGAHLRGAHMQGTKLKNLRRDEDSGKIISDCFEIVV
jgi:hypothetical protein